MLIAKGAEVNAKTESGWTPLHWAARNSAAEVAKLLIAKGAEVNAKSEGGRTPFALGGAQLRGGGCEIADCQRRGCQCEKE